MLHQLDNWLRSSTKRNDRNNSQNASDSVGLIFRGKSSHVLTFVSRVFKGKVEICFNTKKGNMKSVALKETQIRLIESKDISWEDMLNRTHHWISDFEFSKFEIEFLERLLTKVAIWMNTDTAQDSTQKLTKKIGNLELRRDLFVRVIKYHQSQIEAVIENPFAYDAQSIREDHRDLEKRIVEFATEVRKKKSAIYRLVEDTVDRERLPHLFEVRKDISAEEY